MAAFLAIAIPIAELGGGGGGSPPGIWGGGNVPMPTPPIYLPPSGGGSPPGIWGGAGQPMPTPPIAMPPVIWPTPPGGGGGGGMPPVAMPPIYYPPGVNPPLFPTHPIAPGGPPGSVSPPLFPTPPIYIPPEGGGEGGEAGQLPGGGFVLIWHPLLGWKLVPVGGLPPVKPGKPTTPDNELPPTAQPKTY